MSACPKSYTGKHGWIDRRPSDPIHVLAVCTFCEAPRTSWSDARPVFRDETRPSQQEAQESGELNREAHMRYGSQPDR